MMYCTLYSAVIHMLGYMGASVLQLQLARRE